MRRIVFPLGTERPPDDTWVDNAHGRVECREIWVVDSEDMTTHLHHVLDWPGVHLSGHLRRSRKPLGQADWESRETFTWVGSVRPDCLTARDVNASIRGYWAIENSVFRVRDVSYDEDRLHGRITGLGLSISRNTAISHVRRLGYRYVPDGWRDIASRPDRGVSLVRCDKLIL